MSRLVYQKSFTVPGVSDCSHISHVSSDRIWICDGENLILANTAGDKLHQLTDIGRCYGGHTVTSGGDLIYIDREYNINKLSTDNKIKTTLIKYTAPWKPVSVYSSPSTGDLLVGMFNTDTRPFTGQVVRYNSTGEITQIKQHDHNTGQDLYREPYYITESRNGDVIVSDWGRGVVVTEHGGKHRFSYRRHPPGSRLLPLGICTDALSNILVCDYNTQTIHILDKNGHFLQEEETSQQGLSSPQGLSYDYQTKLLWVGSWDNNTVNIYRVTYDDSLTQLKEAFKNELKHGSCKIRQVRIMVVGHYGVGKTTLTYGLIGKDKKGIESTDGIDLFRARCRIDDSNDDSRKWRLVKGNFLSPAALAAAPNASLDHQTESERSTGISVKTPGFCENKATSVDEKQKQTLNLSQNPSSRTYETVTPLSESVKSSEEKPAHKKTKNANNVQSQNTEQSSMEEERSKNSSDFYEKSQKAWTAELENRMKNIFIDMWDFGGQNVFYTTHQSFLTSRCMYLLVINCAQDLNTALQDRSLYPTQQSGSKVQDFIDFWVSTITNYAKSEKSGFPRIILIGTHVDEVRVDIPTRVQKICLQIKENYQDLVDKGQLIVNEDLFLNAKDTDEEKHAFLREFIIQQARLQPHWEEPFPKSWLHLLDFIVTKREKGIDILPLKELKEFNQNSIVPLTDVSLENMLQRQHAIGDIIFFNIRMLKDIIILDPSFLIRALKSLISTRGHMEKSGVNSETWRNLSTTGVVSEDTIKDIWSKNSLLHNNADILLGVFQHMDILVKPKSYVDGKQVNVNQEKIFFIPCMIEESDSIERVDKFLESSKELYKFYDISINNGILVPPAIGYRLLSFCTSMWPVVEKRLFTACGFFRLDLHHILILRTFPSYIRVYTVHRRSKSSISAVLYNSVNRTLISFLDTCLLQFHENFKIVNGCQELQDDASSQENQKCKDNCPGFECSCQKLVEDVEILRLARYLNPQELGIVGTELGILDMDIKRIQAEHTSINDQRFYVLHEWRKRSQPTFSDLERVLVKFDLDKHTLCKVYKTSYFDMKVIKNIPNDKLEKVLSDQELDQVAGYIGREYFQLSLELGLTVSRIEQIIEDHRDNVLKRIKSLLHEWRKTCQLKPTVKMLGCALLQSGGDFHSFCQLFIPKQEDDLWLPHSLFPK
ncbi:uncharacterized protein LOC133202038 [Saccostrea echinata]|uniref:uncharacterized protein LOC133202038 n=1 Tax=Saccostrea echinata TaxID=191078 RepID=UPI002A817976|nr:uncharacterized protein LOC133202038 [Saccostrea echinata]